MSKDPVLILQMQRLGDLVLSYPLLGWLSVVFPGHPLWVVGEERFFSGLIPLSPQAVYFDYSAADELKGPHYKAVINLSHREEALSLAASLKTERLIGPYRGADGAMHISGDWQLYRASLTHNNRHNRYHWADLNGLDLIDASRLLRTNWPLPRAPHGGASSHIGLFLGASEADKRPDESFWLELARGLLQAGHRPVLLGGEAERDMGQSIARKLEAPALSLCGRFSIRELAEFIAELDLFVSPDTGPMHVAVWTGTPTLNLSMGPVNTWETGPFSPGHHVLRACVSCVGCWQCTQPSVLCKEHFSPSRTAFLVHQLVTAPKDSLAGMALPGQELLLTGRGAFGLYMLTPLQSAEASFPSGRMLLDAFWQSFFGRALGLMPEAALRTAWQDLATRLPQFPPLLAKSLSSLNRRLAEGMRKGENAPLREPDFWQRNPAFIRPLASYVQLLLQNDWYSRAAYANALRLTELLAALPR